MNNAIEQTQDMAEREEEVERAEGSGGKREEEKEAKENETQKEPNEFQNRTNMAQTSHQRPSRITEISPPFHYFKNSSGIPGTVDSLISRHSIE